MRLECISDFCLCKGKHGLDPKNWSKLGKFTEFYTSIEPMRDHTHYVWKCFLTCFNAPSKAIHLALEPQITPSAYCRPSFNMAGWMFPGPRLRDARQKQSTKCELYIDFPLGETLRCETN